MMVSTSVLADAVLRTNSDAIVASDKTGIIRFGMLERSASSAMRAVMRSTSQNEVRRSVENEYEAPLARQA
jgi:hypothetical protein